MYIDLLKDHYNIQSPEKTTFTSLVKKDSRFEGIYKPEENISSSSSDEEQTLGSKKLSNRKSQKLLNYLLVEINSSR